MLQSANPQPSIQHEFIQKTTNFIHVEKIEPNTHQNFCERTYDNTHNGTLNYAVDQLYEL